MSDFVTLLDPINALADHWPGFVWRLQTDDGNATSIPVFDDDRLIVNLSVWESIEALRAFVYDSGHLDVMRRRREWFERVRTHIALWWLPVGVLPSVADAELRLTHLRDHGPSPVAFTFKSQFLPDSRVVIDDRIGCPA